MRNHRDPNGAASRDERRAAEDAHRERRRLDMHAAEGHAGSIPRGNPELEREKIGHRRDDFDRLLPR